MAAAYLNQKRAIQATLLDVDVPFLQVLACDPIPLHGGTLEMLVGGQAYCLQVVPSKPAHDGSTWVRLLESDRIARAVEHQFLQQRLREKDQERRNVSRVRTTLVVSSPDLPNQRATTYDVSETGLRLVTERPLPVGAPLRLSIEDPCGESVEVEGEAVWTAGRMNSLFHIGVRLGGSARV